VPGAAPAAAGEMPHAGLPLGLQSSLAPAPSAPSRSLAPAGAAAAVSKRAARLPEPWEWALGQPPPQACRVLACCHALPDQATSRADRTAHYSRRQGVCLEHLRAQEVELLAYRLRFCQARGAQHSGSQEPSFPGLRLSFPGLFPRARRSAAGWSRSRSSRCAPGALGTHQSALWAPSEHDALDGF
jgi:hypothetical protein